MVPALPSVDGRSSDRGEKLDLSLVCCARIHSFRGGVVCVGGEARRSSVYRGVLLGWRRRRRRC